MRGLRNTHKMWWECSTGIAFTCPAAKTWRPPIDGVRVSRWSVADWSNPASRNISAPTAWWARSPVRLEGFPNSLHGPISTFEHPQAGQRAGAGAGSDDVIGNRLLPRMGVGDDGILQIVDRKSCCRIRSAARGPVTPDRPTNGGSGGRASGYPLYVAGPGRPHQACRCSG